MRGQFSHGYGSQLIIVLRNILACVFIQSSAAQSGPSLVCCNGGVPYNRYQNSDFTFHAINATQSNCILYQIEQNGGNFELTCRCQPGSTYFGDRCEFKIDQSIKNQDKIDQSIRNQGKTDQSIKSSQEIDATASLNASTAAFSGNENSSFKIFLFIAIIPLTFALLAGFGAFLCRMCFCDCFAFHDYCKRCWSKDPYNLETASDLAAEADSDRCTASYRYRPSIDITNVDEQRHLFPQRQTRQNDFPPPFDAVGQNSAGNAFEGARNVVTIQPKPENGSPFNLKRKHSPPPPYSAIVDAHSKDAATQTGIQTVV